MLQKETRDAARKAGKDGGKVFSDEMLESFRKKWGGASGFAASLGADDKKIVDQFRKLGGFTSKAYADQFSKTIRPAYQKTAKQLVEMFNRLTAGGMVIDLSKNFRGGPEMEAQIRRTKDLMDELAASMQMGLADTPAGFDPAFLEKYRGELEKTLVILDKANEVEEARRQTIERGVLTVQKATSASAAYEAMSKKEIKAAVANADAQEKILATRLKELEALREQTYQKIDLKTATIEENKAYLATESALRQQTLARTNELQVQLKQITQGKELDELGKKKAKQAREVIALLEAETEVRIKANKELDKSVTNTKKALVSNEQAITNWLVSLDDLGIVLSNTQRQYDRQISTWDEMARASKVVIAAHKDLKGSAEGIAEANTEMVASTKRQKVSLEESIPVMREFSEVVADMLADRGAFSEHVEAEVTGRRKATKALDDYIDSAEHARESQDRQLSTLLRLRLGFMSFSTVLADIGREVQDLVRPLNDLRPALKDVTAELDDADRGARRTAGAFDFLGDSISNIGTRSDLNPRAIAGIIAVLGEPIAVLTGSLGPALLAVGSAAAAGIAGIGGLAAVFSVLGEDVDDLPAELQGVARGFSELKSAMSGVRMDIAAGAFAQMEGSLPRIAGAVNALGPAFQELGGYIGKVIDQFSVGFNTRGFVEIDDLLRRSGPMFESLAGSVGTFFLSLLTGFRRAQPMTDAFLGWLEDITDTFDAFVQGPGFDDWLGHAMTIFSSLNGLLEATGRMLNNLVTDESVERTAHFIDNLAAFMPHLQNIISVFGELDVLGVLTQALLDIGDAMLPLVGPFTELAAVLSDQLVAGFEGVAAVVGALAVPLAGLATVLTAVLDAIPGPVVAAIASALFSLALALGAVAAVKGLATVAGGIASLVTSMGDLTGTLGKVEGVGPRTAKALSGLGKAGIAGAAAAGVIALSGALDDLYNQATDVTGRATELVASNGSIKESYEEMGKSVFGVISPLEDVDLALDNLTGSEVEGMIGSLGNAFRVGGTAANALSQTLGDLSPAMATLAQNDLPAATSQFKAWTDELGASDAQILNMLNTMPEFKAEIVAVAEAEDGLATAQDLVRIATEGAIPPISENTELLAALGGAATLTKDQVNSLADSIRNFGDTTISTIEAEIAFEASLDELNAMIAENTATLDLGTEAGRENKTGLLEAVQAVKDHTAATFEETSSIELANATLDTQRQRLIDTIKEFDAAGYEAGLYTDVLDTIPTDIETVAELNDTQAMADLAELTKARTVKITAQISSSGNPVYRQGDRLLEASGDIFRYRTDVTVGEAGPEAIVPLNRPLSMVDPSVRALSAFAQGKSMPAGITQGGSSRVVNIAEGAIVVQGVTAPESTATHTVNRIAERISG